MHQAIRPPRLARSIRQLALTSAALLALTVSARAQWAVVDAQNIANTAQTVTKLTEQIKTMEQQLDQAKQLLAATGKAGPLSGFGSALSLPQQMRSQVSGLYDLSQYGNWQSKDARSPDFNSVTGARDFYTNTLTAFPTSYQGGGVTQRLASRAPADLMTIRNRRRAEADQAALSGLAIAAQTPAAVQQTITQATDLSERARAAVTEREQLALVVDGLGAVVAQLGRLEMQMASINRQIGGMRMDMSPAVYDGTAEPTTSGLSGGK